MGPFLRSGIASTETSFGDTSFGDTSGTPRSVKNKPWGPRAAAQAKTGPFKARAAVGLPLGRKAALRRPGPGKAVDEEFRKSKTFCDCKENLGRTKQARAELRVAKHKSPLGPNPP